MSRLLLSTPEIKDTLFQNLRILSGNLYYSKLDMWHEGSYAGTERGQRAGLKPGKLSEYLQHGLITKTEFFLLL